MRNSDQVKEIKSYVVVWDANKQKHKVKGEFWVPGYTEEHKATPEEAIQHAASKCLREIGYKQRFFDELKEMMAEAKKEKI